MVKGLFIGPVIGRHEAGGRRKEGREEKRRKGKEMEGGDKN